jgi:DNA-binding transcriptional ArsR family regulator
VLNDSSKLDRAFQALADPARRGMLARLARGPATVSELAGPLKMSLPGVLLIRSEMKGRVRTCRLQPGVLAAAEQWLVDRRSEWEVRHDRFEEYVMGLKEKEKSK